MSEEALGWEVLAQEGEARAGLLRTRRGLVETPVFMPVGTLGSVKGVRFEELEAEDLDARIILGNTYHLWLRPGPEVIRAVRRGLSGKGRGSAPPTRLCHLCSRSP